MFQVHDMMTCHPHTLTPTHTLKDASTLMSEAGIRHIPILDDKNKLIGIVTQRDILASQTSTLVKDLVKDLPEDNWTDTTPLSDLMHKEIASINPKAGLKEAAMYMQRNKIGCLPVVCDDLLVGIITDTDFVTVAINLLELQDDAEPIDYDELDYDDVLEAVVRQVDELDDLDIEQIKQEKDELI